MSVPFDSLQSLLTSSTRSGLQFATSIIDANVSLRVKLPVVVHARIVMTVFWYKEPIVDNSESTAECMRCGCYSSAEIVCGISPLYSFLIVEWYVIVLLS